MTPLTPAQLSALADAAAGLTAPQAAALRGQSPRTVHTLRAQAIKRLFARNLTNAVYCATVAGLIKLPTIYSTTITNNVNEITEHDRKRFEKILAADLSEPDAPAPMTRVSRELAALDRAQMERRR